MIAFRKHRTSLISMSAMRPGSPFAPVAVPMPPLLPQRLRAEEPPSPVLPEPAEEYEQHPLISRPTGVMIWRKFLTQSEAFVSGSITLS